MSTSTTSSARWTGGVAAEQQQRLRSLSSRAEISATRLANEYSFGNFRGDPGRLLEEYFDAYLYAANWGTRELAFRLPRTLLDAGTARRYCDDEHRAWVTETAEHVIVRFRWEPAAAERLAGLGREVPGNRRRPARGRGEGQPPAGTGQR